MKSKYNPGPNAILNATRIEVHQLLSDNFGSQQPEMSNQSRDELGKMNFSLDRLFTVIHNN